MQTTINNFLADLTKNPRWNHLKLEVRKKLNAELAKLKASIGQDTWHTAEKNYNQIIKKLSLAQKQVDQEVQKTLKTIKKSAAEIEKTIGQYKAIALKEKAQVRKSAPVKKATRTAKKAKKTPATRKKVAKA
jgi:hypothetical protein